MSTGGRVTVVGIGADGWSGLTQDARDAALAADVVVGSPRQLDLLPESLTATPRAWPSPLVRALPDLFVELADRCVCVLASGDPMFFGIGATLARVLGPDRLRVIPAPSSVALACARLGWPEEDVDVVSVVGRPLARIRRALAPGRRLIVLSAGAGTPAEIAALLDADGWGPSALALLEQLGGPGERLLAGHASDWPHPPGDALNLVAVSCEPGPGARVLGETAGLPDDAYDHHGPLTKPGGPVSCCGTSAPAPGASPSSGCGHTRRAGPSPSSRTSTGSPRSPATPTRSASPAWRSCPAVRPRR